MVSLGIECGRKRQDFRGTELDAKPAGLAPFHHDRNRTFGHPYLVTGGVFALVRAALPAALKKLSPAYAQHVVTGITLLREPWTGNPQKYWPQPAPGACAVKNPLAASGFSDITPRPSLPGWRGMSAGGSGMERKEAGASRQASVLRLSNLDAMGLAVPR
jgi:hypothetical protein